MAWAVYPGPTGLAHFIDEVEVPSILRNKRCTRQPSCASVYTLKLTRKIEHLPWRRDRSGRDDNWSDNPPHHRCERDVIIERLRRSGCSDVVENYVLTCHDPMARDWLCHMLRSACSNVVDNYVMTRHGLMARDWLRRMLRLEGLDYLCRPDDPL